MQACLHVLPRYVRLLTRVGETPVKFIAVPLRHADLAGFGLPSSILHPTSVARLARTLSPHQLRTRPLRDHTLARPRIRARILPREIRHKIAQLVAQVAIVARVRDGTPDE